MSRTVLAIDPGTTESAFVQFDAQAQTILDHGIFANELLLAQMRIQHGSTRWGHQSLRGVDCVLEMVASYGMPVGREVFETVFWTGRFAEAWGRSWGDPAARLYRADVKLHLCHVRTAKDSNIRQALIDRFGGSKEAAIGVKKKQGPLYGIRADEWAALALAVTYADQHAKVLEAA